MQKIGGISTPAAMDWLAVGTSAQAESDADTTLIAEVTTDGLARFQDASPTASTTTETDDTLEISHDFSVTGSQTVREVAVLNAASAGTMIGRSVLGVEVVFNNGDTCEGLYMLVFA
ncbi:MAG: hypothetical protein JRC86_08395 [Deltaproteobacteria bacterium]|nr:hypothetical protein [Deltaproteobacteria bacterium]